MMAVTESDHRPVGFYAAGAPNAEYFQLTTGTPRRGNVRRRSSYVQADGHPPPPARRANVTHAKMI